MYNITYLTMSICGRMELLVGIFSGGVTPHPGVPSSAIPHMRDEERWLDKPDNEVCSDKM